MPKPTRPELFCAALYTLTGGKLKGLMVTTVAEELGITFEEAEELAAECAKRNWLEHAVHIVVLRTDGFAAALRGLQAVPATETARRPSRRPKAPARAKATPRRRTKSASRK